MYFPIFGLNTEIYSVSLRIQSGCGKIETRLTPNIENCHAEFAKLEKWKYGDIWKHLIMIFKIYHIIFLNRVMLVSAGDDTFSYKFMYCLN